jgi:hypothetical protein
MTITPPLALSNIVDINVTVSPAAATQSTFNQGLFIGSSTAIPSYGANSRLRQYSAASYLTAMLTDGFTVDDPEYIAAGIYFSQTPQPGYIWIGRQDLTAIGTLAVDVGGTGWAVGDEFTITQAGGSNGIGRVTTINAGVVTAIEIVQQGTGYAVATGLATTAVSPATGTGLTVDIDTIGESLLQAATACRSASDQWYGLAVYNPVDADNLAIAAWADPLWQTTRYYLWSSDVGIPNATTNNLAAQLKTLKYRTVGIYSTTQSGGYPNNIYAAVALMGVDMGYQTNLAGSFFTLAHKQLRGIAVEPLTQTQYNNLLSQNFNAYCNMSPYSLFEPGVLSSGDPSFLWLYLAILVNLLQINELNVLQSRPVVAQTNTDEHLLLDAANQACQTLANVGFLAPGTWEGVEINIIGVTLSVGQTIPSGYLNQAQPYSQQSSGDRAAGKAMPIYCAITTAGAVQSLVIGVYTQL